MTHQKLSSAGPVNGVVGHRDEEQIRNRQRLLSPIIHGANQRRSLLATAQWWRLESYRGYASSGQSYQYYLNLRSRALVLPNPSNQGAGLPGSAELRCSGGGNCRGE